jgi:hypothetical protein
MTYRDKMQRGIASIRAQGQRVFQIEIVFPWNVPELMWRARHDEQAAYVRVMLNRFLADMAKARRRPSCLLCDHSFAKKERPAAFVMLMASVDDPHASIGSALCLPCAIQEQLTERVTQKYKESMIPDLRVLPQPSAPGRA